MNRRNFFTSLVSAVMVKASVELGVLEEAIIPVFGPVEYKGEWRWVTCVAGKETVSPVFHSETLDLLHLQRNREEYLRLAKQYLP